MRRPATPRKRRAAAGTSACQRIRTRRRTAPWRRRCPKPRRSCWCRAAWRAPRRGRTLNSTGTRISPPPPTIESTKPANNEARVSTSNSMAKLSHRLVLIGTSIALPQERRRLVAVRRTRPKRKGADQRRLVQKNGISCGCLLCLDCSEFGKLSPRSPALPGRPVCEWRDFSRCTVPVHRGLPRLTVAEAKHPALSAPPGGSSRPPSPPSSASGCWCCRW